jgi:hypothetical protein
MFTPSNEILKAKIPKPTQSLEQQLEDVKARLKAAFKAIAIANRKSHNVNKIGMTNARGFAYLGEGTMFTYTTLP